MTWRGPTLGWGVLEWMASYLPNPRDVTKPFIATDEQAELILAWYAVDRLGAFLHRRAICERAKGWGKSPVWGAVALAELGASQPDDSAPVLFDGWRGREPVGRPWGTSGSPSAWVQIAAVSEDQTANTYSAMYEMLVANGHRAAIALGIDDGRTRLLLRARAGQLEPVTASAGSREGQPITYTVMDETHLWTRLNGGIKLAGTLRRNVAKMNGRSVETTNAPALGEQSVAEQSGVAAERGFAGILYDAKRWKEEPDPDWTDEQMLEALDFTYGDAIWVDRPRLLADIRDPATDWSDALRYFFNWRVAGGGKAIDPRVWDRAGEGISHDPPPAGTEIGLGFDGSISEDATVLRGCTREGYSFLIDAWVRPDDPEKAEGWRVDRRAVKEAVKKAFATWRVGRMNCDPPKWSIEIDDWAEEYGEDIVLNFDTNQSRRFAPAVDRWRTGLREGTHTHDADPLTSDHVKASHLRKIRPAADEDDSRTMYVIIKGEDRRKIDAAVADVLAFEAAMTMPALPKILPPMFAWR